MFRAARLVALLFATLCVPAAVVGTVVSDRIPADLARLIVVPSDPDNIFYFAGTRQRALIYIHTIPQRRGTCRDDRASVTGVWIADFGADVVSAAVEYRTQKAALRDAALLWEPEPLADVDSGESFDVQVHAPDAPAGCQKFRRETLFRLRGMVVFVSQDHHGTFEPEKSVAMQIRRRLGDWRSSPACRAPVWHRHMTVVAPDQGKACRSGQDLTASCSLSSFDARPPVTTSREPWTTRSSPVRRISASTASPAAASTSSTLRPCGARTRVSGVRHRCRTRLDLDQGAAGGRAPPSPGKSFRRSHDAQPCDCLDGQ